MFRFIVQFLLLQQALAWGWFGSQPTTTHLSPALPSASASRWRPAIPVSLARLRGKTAPTVCDLFLALGDPCGDIVNNCCANGSICSGQQCVQLCPRDTLSRYCQSQSDCPEEYGYSCIRNECKVPETATTVKVGEACDQGTNNTLFCSTGQAVCVNGTCEACTLH